MVHGSCKKREIPHRQFCVGVAVSGARMVDVQPAGNQLQVPEEEDAGSSEHQQRRHQQRPPRRRVPWIPRWLCGSPRARRAQPPPDSESKLPPRPVLCSINLAPVAAAAAAGAASAAGGKPPRAPQRWGPFRRRAKRSAGGGVASAPAADAPDTRVTIGGVEELLEFVRSSVLAGPRPFSFAFHEQSLR